MCPSRPLSHRWNAESLFASLPSLLFSCIVTTVSFMLASISTQYWHFLLSQGFLMGIGLGSSFSPALACVASYYKRRRGIASGLLSAGSAFGGLILPIAQSKMISNFKIGLGWALRMTGFLALLFQGTAWLVMKQKKIVPSKRPMFDVSVYKQKAYTLTAIALFFTTMSMFVSNGLYFRT
jgi:MFS family permease